MRRMGASVCHVVRNGGGSQNDMNDHKGGGPGEERVLKYPRVYFN